MGSCKEQEEEQEKGGWVQGPIVVGAGPSGLAVAACLAKQGIPCAILEKSDCIASLWQHRTYERLKLHLPKQFYELPLMGFPENFSKYPNKHQFISYMESYAAHFSIKPRFNQAVCSAKFNSSSGGYWTVRTQDSEYSSWWLIVAKLHHRLPFRSPPPDREAQSRFPPSRFVAAQTGILASVSLF